ncbi:phosphate ABC transporter ATP-binding protein [Tritonibacter scottomollicae]|uniref:phosphate ABC transporter ATP-binding protein n=1 Tax=Tritonibacter scottomollicae TaxID=483013 RepID=UPI003AA8D524
MFDSLPKPQHDVHQTAGEGPAGDPGPALMSLQGFSASINGQLLLRDLSFDLHQGEVLGLIGRAGAGKTALLRAMCRLLDEHRGLGNTGHILLDGADIYHSACDLPTLRRQLAFISQQANPFPMSIWDNIAYGVRLNRIASTPSQVAEVVETVLRRCLLWDDVKDLLHEMPATKLPIQRQRLLCIARSLAIRPKVLLLDRPTGSIDRMELALLNRLIADLKQDHTVVLVTASLTETAHVADRVAYLEEGRLVEIDSAEMIFTAALNQSTRDFINSTAM